MPARPVILPRLMLAAVLVFAPGGRMLQAQDTSGAAVEGEIATAPVELDGAVLFRLRGVSSFPAEARARVVGERLVAVGSDSAIPLDSLRSVDDEGMTRVVAGDRTILTVLDADATLEQVQRRDLAAAHLVRIRQAIASYRDARSPAALRRGTLKALAATGVLALAIVGLWWVWGWVDRFLASRVEARIHSVGIQSFEVMRAERIRSVLRNGLHTFGVMVFLAVGLVYIGYALAQFPGTRGLSRNLLAFVLAPLRVMGSGLLANVPSLLFLVVLFFVVRVLLRLIRLFFDSVARGTVTLAGFDPEWAAPTYKIVRAAVVAFAVIVAYPYVPGSQSDAFKGVSIFIGIVFSLGSSSAISNIIAGYMMTYRRAFKVGDRVKIGDTVGDVIETRLQVTHLRSFKNEEVIIPNSQILSGEVRNYSSLARTHGLILHTEVGIGYETPWRQVEAMLLAAAQRTPGLEAEPRPFVLEKALGDFAVTYELNAYCRDVPAMNLIYAALHRSILDVFNEQGIQIMTPAYEGDPAEPKVVPPTHPFAAPGRT